MSAFPLLASSYATAGLKVISGEGRVRVSYGIGVLNLSTRSREEDVCPIGVAGGSSIASVGNLAHSSFPGYAPPSERSDSNSRDHL
jgi:hypothetical protein